MSLALATQTVHHDLRTKRLYITVTPTGNYVTGGDTVDFSKLTAALGMSDALIGYPGVIKDFTVISAPPGYAALLIAGTALTNWKLKVFQNAGFTPAGTNSAPTITTGTNVTVTAVVATNAGALTQATGAAGITGVQAPVFTGTAVAAAAQSELPASAYPAGVTSGTFVIMVEGPKGRI